MREALLAYRLLVASAERILSRPQKKHENLKKKKKPKNNSAAILLQFLPLQNDKMPCKYNILFHSELAWVLPFFSSSFLSPLEFSSFNIPLFTRSNQYIYYLK
jgi:hypothetical protein